MTSDNHSDLSELLAQMQALRGTVSATQQTLLEKWRPQLRQREFAASAKNLAAYIGLRRQDLRLLQKKLGALGLSSLGRCESHVIATLESVIHALQGMLGKPVAASRLSATLRAMNQAETRLRRHTDRLLGAAPPQRWTRFMVTLPSEAADNYELVRDMLAQGMNCARINCAHDDVAAWRKMVEQVRRAQRETAAACKILMDLPGPKLRTGELAPGLPVLHLRVKRDVAGNLLRPAYLVLDGSGRPGCSSGEPQHGEAGRLSVPAAWLNSLDAGDQIVLRDNRGKRRTLQVEQKLGPSEVLASCAAGAYLAPGTKLKVRGKPASRRARSGEFAAAAVELRVRQGDALLLARAARPGQAAQSGANGAIAAPAFISCSEPRVFDFLCPGQAVWIDDGRIGATIERVDRDGAWLRITHARPQGERILAGKGLNFPDSTIALPALSKDDAFCLDFAAAHADLVGYSFVQSAADMELLLAELAQRGGKQLGIIAKIETRAAVSNLPEIIVHGAGSHPFGVMIARGDLAVEIGYERMAEIQEEILWLCEAAQVPVVWATQVLENLVKQALPSRAEMTDAAMSERAECVMLNKGPYLLQALNVLDSVVARMAHHQQKKTAQFRALHW